MNGVLDLAKDAFYAASSTLTSCLCAPSASIKLNGRSFKIIKLLGEGGFSFVYLAEDSTSGRHFALKKIRCPLGSESVREAMKEVEAYRRFRHPNCIRCLDSCVIQERDGKVIYLFLPYYRRGNLQDAIAAHAVNGTHFAERDMLALFLGTCEAVRAMHIYIAGPTATYPPSASADAASPTPTASTSRSKVVIRDAEAGSYARTAQEDDDDDDDDDEGEPTPLAPIDSQQQPLIGNYGHTSGDGVEEDAGPGHMPGLGDEEGAKIAGRLDPEPKTVGKAAAGQAQPWAHRDLKPANIMISDDGKQPIVFDFGSALPARIPIPNRSVALTEQDRAAEHSSMPYRAPELFDVKTGVELDEKVDIWSLGCTLFAMAYGTSPFEANPQEAGGSLAMAVLNGAWRFPANDKVYSQGFRDLVSAMLVVEPSKRPDIHRVIELTKAALARVQ